MNYPYKEYYLKYRSFIEELKKLEKTIRQDIDTFRCKSQNSKSTLPLKNNIKEKLKQFKELQGNLETAYFWKNVPGGIPQLTIDERLKEIRKFGINYNELEKEFRNIENDKYSYKGEITEDYSQKEEHKMTTGEIQSLQKRKLQEQDETFEEMVRDLRKGRNLPQYTINYLKGQKKELDKMKEDIERTRDKSKI